MQTFQVYRGSDVVGKAELTEEGLYTRISCRCQVEGDTMYRLQALGEEMTLDLGILVPMDGKFGAEIKIPTKRIPKRPQFRMKPRNAVAGKQFIPIYPEEPFAYLSRIKEGAFARKNGQPGILLEL